MSDFISLKKYAKYVLQARPTACHSHVFFALIDVLPGVNFANTVDPASSTWQILCMQLSHDNYLQEDDAMLDSGGAGRKML